MINEAKIINQPYSGQYEEKIYDIPSSWNSQKWTWIKFSNEDSSEWCGEFRGSSRYVQFQKNIIVFWFLHQTICTNLTASAEK